MKGIFNFIRFVVVILVIGFMIYFAGRNNRENYCNLTDITIEMNKNAFVTNDVINNYLLDHNLHPDSIKVNDVSFKNIEYLLVNHPSIKSANVYSDMQGKIYVSVIQRKPIVRVQNGKEGYYLDEDGLRMELSNEYTARMLLVTGDVNSVNENDLYYLSDFIINDKFLKKQIVQIYVSDSELLMLTQ
ncbi:MAG: cell division protein FtsQ/DivIB, partial [Flavobacteriales bacterium]